ncbi:MAG TPA: pitrilysin family protein [Candidatus Acidoferrales bacterium]|nr:pitrilysin family protein [Candidatus Acidoferrales bacterium]
MRVATANAADPAADRRTLPNGALLIVSEQHALPMVVVQMIIDAGARRDPHGQEGLAALTADLLTEGTKTRSATQISAAADFIGASLGSSADTDYASLSLTVLGKDLDTGLTLLTDILLHPSFPDAEVKRRREAALANMKANEDDPGNVAQRVFVHSLFGDEPYGHLAIGTPPTVPGLTRKDLVAFYERYYRPEHSIITVVGDVTAADIEQRLQNGLKDWSPANVPAFAYPSIGAPHPVTLTVQKPISQANIILGQRGVARDNPDYYALTIMNYVLGGGGFSSRLLDNIRTKAGLAYSVGSFFSVNKSPGSFQVVMQTKNESANDAIQRACDEIARIRTEPISDDELKEAKLYLTGSFPLRLDTNAKIAGFLAQVEFFNLGADYADTYAQRINAVTKEDVLRAAQQYLQPEQLELVVVANLEQAKIPTTAPCGRNPES